MGCLQRDTCSTTDRRFLKGQRLDHSSSLRIRLLTLPLELSIDRTHDHLDHTFFGSPTVADSSLESFQRARPFFLGFSEGSI